MAVGAASATSRTDNDVAMTARGAMEPPIYCDSDCDDDCCATCWSDIDLRNALETVDWLPSSVNEVAETAEGCPLLRKKWYKT